MQAWREYRPLPENTLLCMTGQEATVFARHKVTGKVAVVAAVGQVQPRVGVGKCCAAEQVGLLGPCVRS